MSGSGQFHEPIQAPLEGRYSYGIILINSRRGVDHAGARREYSSASARLQTLHAARAVAGEQQGRWSVGRRRRHRTCEKGGCSCDSAPSVDRHPSLLPLSKTVASGPQILFVVGAGLSDRTAARNLERATALDSCVWCGVEEAWAEDPLVTRSLACSPVLSPAEAEVVELPRAEIAPTIKATIVSRTGASQLTKTHYQKEDFFVCTSFFPLRPLCEQTSFQSRSKQIFANEDRISVKGTVLTLKTIFASPSWW